MTPKERIEGVASAALSFVVDLRKSGNHYPTYLELAAFCGCSKADAYAAVDLLVRKGKLRKLNDRSKRSIRLPEDPYPRPWLHPSNLRFKE